MSDTVEQVKERLDIADFIRTYIPLHPAGKNFRALCPFHKEKTPSFIVSPDRQSWHCFGCNTGGDAIAFLMKYENLEFYEALKVLAEKTGVNIRLSSSADQKQYAVLYDINDAAKDFFKAQLAADMAMAANAREYLKDRGLHPDTTNEFELGFSPNSSDTLSRTLLKAGYAIVDIERAGLVFKTERGTYWDRFRNRIMFPLHNHFGKVIGFTGRIMPGAAEEGIGKYVNSPETPIFNKSKLLFGFYKSKNAIRESRTVVLVEGQMDFLMVWQDGVKNAVASSGTAFTPEHLKSLKRVADTIIIAFDRDEAGQAATEKVIDLAAASDFSVKILGEPTQGIAAKDPADLVKEAPGAMRHLIGVAQPAMHHYFSRYITAPAAVPAASADIASLKANIRLVLLKIKTIASPVEQAYWVKELSARTHIAETHLFEEMKSVRSAQSVAPTAVQTASVAVAQFSRWERIAQRFIGLAFTNKAFVPMLYQQLQFLPSEYEGIARHLLSEEPVSASAQSLADFIRMSSSLELEPSDEKRTELEWGELLKHLKQEYYKAKTERIGAAIAAAEQAGDEARLTAALAEFDKISKEMYTL